MADINIQGASDVASELSARGPRSAAFEVDVTDRGSVDRMVARVIEAFGRIDILVNSAGIIGARDILSGTSPATRTGPRCSP